MEAYRFSRLKFGLSNAWLETSRKQYVFEPCDVGVVVVKRNAFEDTRASERLPFWRDQAE